MIFMTFYDTIEALLCHMKYYMTTCDNREKILSSFQLSVRDFVVKTQLRYQLFVKGLMK